MYFRMAERGGIALVDYTEGYFDFFVIYEVVDSDITTHLLMNKCFLSPFSPHLSPLPNLILTFEMLQRPPATK